MIGKLLSKVKSQALGLMRLLVSFLWRLNEYNGLLTALATIVIAYLTLSLAHDSKRQAEISAGQLVTLQGQLKEMQAARESNDQSVAAQLAVMRDQNRTMQGQLDQMEEARRAWLMVDKMSVSEIQQFPAGAGIVAFASYHVTNIGHSPASAIFIKTALVLNGIDRFDAKTTHELCESQPSSEDDRLLDDYTDSMVPGQTQVVEGIGQGSSFAHSVENLVAEREARFKSDREYLEQRFGEKVPPLPPSETKFAIDPVAVGCITYKTVGSNTVHRTGFAFRLEIGPFDALFVEVGAKGTVNHGPLQVTPTPSGNFTD